MKRTELLLDPGIADLVPRYVRGRRDDVAEIRDLVVRDQYGEIERRGHQMAGSGSAFGFAIVSLVGLRLESAARQRDRAGVLAAIWWLEEYLDSVVLVYPDPESPGDSSRG